MQNMIERTRQNDSFNAWYSRRKASYNEERRERYQQDSEFRERARLQAAKYRQRIRDDNHIPDRRQGLSTSTRVAALLKVSTQTLRNWEARGVIPKTTQGGKHRLYTDHQVGVLESFFEIIRADPSSYEAYHTIIFNIWNKPDGT